MFDGRNITSGLPDELVKVVDFLNEKASAGEFEFSDSVSYWWHQPRRQRRQQKYRKNRHPPPEPRSPQSA